MQLKKWSFTIAACLFWFGIGFVYVSAIVHSYWSGYNKPEPVQKGIWTPANEIPRGECELKLPEIDMKDAKELLPREIYVGQISYLQTSDHDGLQLEQHEIDMIKFTNEYRVRNGRKPLKATRRLMGTARLQAWKQIRNGMRHGMTSGWRAENIAMGQQSAREVVNTWINSPGHRSNMLGNHTYIGVGGYGNHWAQQFE